MGRIRGFCLVVALFVPFAVVGCGGSAPGWRRVAAPDNDAYAIVAVDASTAFAFGRDHALAWDGRRWRTSPDRTARDVVAAVPVPHQRELLGIGGHQLLRWDGRWHRGPSAGGGVQLSAVAATGPDAGWVVGEAYPGAGAAQRPYAARWDGHRLARTAVPVPAGAAAAGLTQVVAAGPSDVWAAGYDEVRAGSNRAGRFTVHWDGRSWRNVPLPRTHQGYGQQTRGLVVTGGTAYLSIDDLGHQLLLRGSGGRWHAVAVPAGLAVAEEPVVADGGGGLWFAGHLGSPGTDPVYVHHRPGHGWPWTPVPQDPRASTDDSWADATVVAFAPVPGTGAIWAIAGSRTGSGEEDDHVTEHTAIQLYGSLG